jgi:predicted homoserine dehydrogenase-like protein
MKTVDRVFRGGGVLLDNSTEPTISVSTIAKRDLKPGETIKKGIGSFDVRGIAVRIKDHKGHVPIGLMKNAVIKRPVARGAELTFDDVELPESLAVNVWKSIENKVFEK